MTDTDKERIEQLARTIDCVLADARATHARGELLPFAAQGALLRIAETGREVAIELGRDRVRVDGLAGAAETLTELARCAEAWHPDACIVGNLRAKDIAKSARAVLAALAEGGKS